MGGGGGKKVKTERERANLKIFLTVDFKKFIMVLELFSICFIDANSQLSSSNS